MKREDYRSAFSDMQAGEDLRKNIEASLSKSTAKRVLPRALRVGAVAAALMMLCCISAGAAYIVKNWDTLFLAYFKPTEAQQSQLNDAVQEMDVSVTKEDITYTITQIIGDTNSFAVAMDISFPEPVATPVLTSFQCALAHVEEAVLAEEAGDISGDTDFGHGRYNKILRGAELSAGTSSDRQGQELLMQEYDEEAKVLSVLLHFNYEQETEGKDCTLVLHQIISSTKNNILSEPVVLNFQTAYETESIDYDVVENGETVGTMTLTQLGAYIDFPAREDENGKTVYSESWEQTSRVTLIMQDGTKIVLSHGSTATNGAWQAVTLHSTTIIDLSQIQEIQCGDLEFLISE